MKVNKTIQYNQRNKYPVQVLSKISDTQYQESISDGTAFHHGTERDGRRGGCYRFNGSTSYIIINGNWNTGSNQFEFFIRFKIDPTIGTEGRRIVALWHTINVEDIRLLSVNGSLRFDIDDGVNDTRIPLSGNYHDNNWHYAFCSLFGTIARIETDLETIEQPNVIFDFASANGSAYLGSGGISASFTRFKGDIFHFLLFDRILTPEERSDILKFRTVQGSLTFYKCDENSGQVSYNSAGNGNHGTIYNSITVPPEENPNSIHQYQDVYSWHNEVGYTYGKLFDNEYYDTGVIGNELKTFESTLIVLESSTVPRQLLASNDASVNRMYIGIRPASLGNTWLIAIGDTGLDTLISVEFGKVTNIVYSYNNGIVTFTSNGQSATLDFTGKIRSTASLFLCARSNSGVPSDYLKALISSASINGSSIDYGINKYFPRNESITLPPFKDVLGNDLQYIGHCQNNADFVGSACLDNSAATQSYAATNVHQSSDYMEYEFWMYPSSNKLSGQSYVIGTRQSGLSACNVYYSASGTALTVSNYAGSTVGSGSGTFLRDEWVLAKIRFFNDTVEFYKNGGLISTGSLLNGSGLTYGPITIGVNLLNSTSQQFVGQLMGVKIKNLDVNGNFVSWFGDYSLSEPILDAGKHIYFDKSGNGNHATLINGTAANQGSQDVFHDLMVNGFGQFFRIDGGSNLRILKTTSAGTDMQSKFTAQVDAKQFNGSTNNNLFIFGSGDNIRVWWWAPTQIRFGTFSASFGAIATVDDTRKLHRYQFVFDPAGASINDMFKIYQDGVLKNSSTYGTFNASIGTIGTDSVSLYRMGLGKNLISNVFIYDSTDQLIYKLNNFLLSPEEYDSGFIGASIFDTDNISREELIPALSIDSTKDALGNPLTNPQNGGDFLDCGTKLRQRQIPELIQADSKNLFFNTDNTAKEKSYDSLRYGNFYDQYFTGNKENEKITVIANHKDKLERNQLTTEIRVRGVDLSDVLDGAIVYYPFNGNYESGISGPTLTELNIGSGSPITFEEDRFDNPNSSVRFNNTTPGGGNSTLLIGDFSHSGATTISFWLYVVTTVRNASCPVELKFNPTTRFNSFSVFTGGITVITGTTSHVISGITPDDLIGKWTHHLIRYDSVGTVDYFVDGIQYLSGGTSAVVPVLGRLALGNGTGGAPYNGRLDDLIIVNRRIGDDEIEKFRAFTS